MDVSKWSNSAGGNTANSPDGAPEGWAPSSVNDWGRETMASVRRWYEDAQWINFGETPTYASSVTFSVAGNLTSRYESGRRIKCYVGANTYYGTVSTSTYSTATGVTLTLDSGALTASLSAIAVASLTNTNRSIPDTLYVSDLTNKIYTKIINIGDWNMDTTNTINVAHGLTLANIRAVSAMIRSDGATSQFMLTPGSITTATEVDAYVAGLDVTNVILFRRTGSSFDAAGYSATSFNRGWIIITYIV